jgi:hypothetical protein
MYINSPILVQKTQQFLVVPFEPAPRNPSDLLESSNRHKIERFASQLLLNIVYTMAKYSARTG